MEFCTKTIHTLNTQEQKQGHEKCTWTQAYTSKCHLVFVFIGHLQFASNASIERASPHQVTYTQTPNLLQEKLGPGWCGSMVDRPPINQEVASSIPNHGTYPSCSRSMFLSSPLPSSLSKSKENVFSFLKSNLGLYWGPDSKSKTIMSFL